jgi:hypothetical protein
MTFQEIIYLLLVFLNGWLVVSMLIKRITLEEHVGLSFLLGFGIHSVLYFTFVLRMGLPVYNNLLFLIFETILFVLLSLVFKKKIIHLSFPKEQGKKKYFKILLVLTSAFILIYTFLQCIYWPVDEPDSLYLYDFRAQRLLAGDLATFFHGTNFYYNYLYPPFTSLMHFFLYQVGTVNPKIFYALIFMAFYLVIVGYVKKITKSNLLGLLAGTLTILTPSIWWNSILGVTNITFMAYISLAILYLFDPSEKDFTTGQIFLGAMLLGFSIWTRIEPFWMVPALLVFIRCLSKWKIKALILFFVFVIPMSYLWPSSVITAPSVTVRTPVNAISAELYHMQRITNTNITQAVGYFSGSLYDSWGLILPLFFAVFALEVVFFKKSFPWIQITAIALTLAIIYGVISFSNWYVRWKGLSSSVYRMAIITVPLYWVSIVNSKIWKKFGRFVGIF